MEMDPIWEAYSMPHDFEGFCRESIPEILLKPIVNKNVHDNFRVVRKLLEHSFYEYQFYDQAALKAIFSFEMAAKIRYKEITNLDWSASLKKLIEWFDKRHYFEVYNQHFLTRYRDIRNHLAHPINSGYAGPLKRQWILHTIDLINAMYEDPKLRFRRKKVTNTISRKLHQLNANGLKLTINGKEILCFEIVLAFIDNKGPQQRLFFYFKPPFPIPENNINSGRLFNSPVYLVIANRFKIFENSIELLTDEGNVLVSKINSEAEQSIFNNWYELYKKYSDQVMENSMWTSQVSSYFEKHLREFHMADLS